MRLLYLLSVLTLSFLFVTADDFQSEEIHIQGSKRKLFGILQYPAQIKHDVTYPLVIICHGFSGNCQSPIEETIAKDVNENGMASFRFDFNGHGKSEGNFHEMTVPNEIQDLKKVIQWAQTLPWVESISLVGHSQGGVVVGMTAGELGDSIIKAEVLLAPAAVLKDDAIRGNTMGARYNPWNLDKDFVELSSFGGEPGLKLGKNYIQSALTLPIYEISSQYKGPALILQGTYDFVVPYTYSERYSYELPKSQLKLIEGEDHGFSITLEETCRFVSDWLKDVLNPKPVNPVKI